MARMTVRGEVLSFSSNQRNIRVQNVDEIRQFWADEKIDNNLDWVPNDVIVTFGVREFVEACEIGDIVDYTIEPHDRADGRRIKGIALEVVTRADDRRP